ncbi:MAG: leucine-rich repeat domain-containing protein, partial [Prevotellaceae bacterium]|nr:leucine-rich repeat domain-containing protein [Prevotellaceae bacterium]
MLVAALHRYLLQRCIVGRYKLTLLHGTTHGFAGDPFFGGCINLTSMTIPEGMESIGKKAFFLMLRPALLRNLQL